MRADQLVRRGGAFLGLAGGLALAWLFARLPTAAALGGEPLQRAVAFAILGALGCGIGFLFGDLSRERAMRRTLAAAGRELSSATDEAGARRALLASLARVHPSGLFEVQDEAGEKLSMATGSARRFASRAGGAEVLWTVRPLGADGRDLGSVCWRLPRRRAGDPLADETTASVVELGALAIGRARLRAEKEAMEDVVRAEQLRTVLLDAVSHHFRSPLAGILGSVTTILDLPEPQERRVRTEFLLIIKEQANRLGRYVENFLSLARIESGALEISLTETNLETLVYDVWDTFGELGGARRYFQVDIEPETIRSDPRLLGQALGNVLENAIKYSPEESLIEVSARLRDGKLMIKIADQGRGVPEAILTRVFDRFYRHQAAPASGIGLGLYITRSLVEMLGGEVCAYNRTDEESGLVIAISLPVVKAKP